MRVSDHTIIRPRDYKADVLQVLYNDTIVYLEDFSAISRAIGGIGALFYISFRVWKHMANAEPINFFPLLRPFVICLCIIFFPQIIDIINGILFQILRASDLIKKPLEIGYGCSISGSIGKMIECALQKTFALIFEGFLEAVKIGLNVMRVFFLILLSILGPLAFGFSIFDGFEGNLSAWLKKYVSIYLWLPVLNILENMCIPFINGIKLNGSFLLVIVQVIVCAYTFLKVPEISGWIVEAPGGFERDWGSKGAGFVINNAKEAIKGISGKGKK